jgi:hypothetical protein
LQQQVILAEEDNPPTGHVLIKLARVKLGKRCLHWSWLSHFVLKSDCRFEDLQLENAERLKLALCIVAWRLLLRSASPTRATMQRGAPGYCFHHRTPHPPPHPPTLRQAVHWIARLGGFLGRRADSEPGVKTIWLGFCRLADIAAAWQLMHGMLGNPPSTYG